MRRHRAVACETFRSRSVEAALSALDGGVRADHRDHLDKCRSCAQEVEQLSRMAVALLVLAPEVEPPPGFELRVLRQVRAHPLAP